MVEWTVNEPHKVAYAIRQGMVAALHLSEQFPEYKELNNAYAIKLQPKQVIATRKTFGSIETNVVEAPTHRVVIKDVGADPLAIVSVCVGIPNWYEVYFPNALNLTDIQMLLIYNWVEGLDDDVSIFQTPEGFTLTKNPQAKELGLQWTPKEESGSQTSQDTITQKQKNMGS